MDKLKFLLVIILVAAVGVVIVQLRWRIPVLKEWFITLGVHDTIAGIEQSVLAFISGSPQALLGIITGSVTMIVALIKAFKDKTSSLINTFSSEKANLATELDNVMGLRSQLEQQVTLQQEQLKGATDQIQQQTNIFNRTVGEKDGQIIILTTERDQLQKSYIELQTKLEKVTIERDAHLISLTEKTQATMH